MDKANHVGAETADAKTKKAALLARKEAREKEAAEKREAMILEALELEEKFMNVGRHGVDYIVVTTDVGNFVVQKPEFVVAKKFNTIPGNKLSDDDFIQLADACLLHPDKTVARGIFAQHGGAATRCAKAALAMYGAEGEALAGKL